MSAENGGYIFSQTVVQPYFDPSKVNDAVPYELLYETGEQTFYFLNPNEFNDFKNLSRWFQKPIEQLTAALNMPADPHMDDPEAQEQIAHRYGSRTGKIIFATKALNSLLKSSIQGPGENTISELIWIPRSGDQPQFVYLKAAELKTFSKKYTFNNKAAQEAIQNERGGVSSSKLINKLKESTTVTVKIADHNWNDGLFTNLAKSLGISEENSGKLYFGNPKDSNSVFVADADAQLLRFVGGASIGAVTEVKNRRFSLSADGNSALDLASATITVVSFSLPCDAGYHVITSVPDRDGDLQPIDLGYLRANISIDLNGFTGASIAGSASIGYKMSDKGQIQMIGTNPGESGNPVPSKGPQTGVIVGANIFVGVQFGCEAACALQWQNPENGHAWNDIASISAEGDISAGAGINGSFCIDYNVGSEKFLVHAAVGVTWGLGCSGDINLVVDAKTVISFVQFVYHQIMKANYVYVGIINNEAFRMLVDIFTNFIFYAKADLVDIFEKEVASLDVWWRTTVRKFADEGVYVNQIYSIVNNINNDPERLIFTPPEVKGRLLYILTDPRLPAAIASDAQGAVAMMSSGPVAYMNPNASQQALSLYQNTMHSIESAILTILSYIQCYDDYENVVTHMGLNPLLKNDFTEGEHWLYENLVTEHADLSRLQQFKLQLNDDHSAKQFKSDPDGLLIFSGYPNYNQPVKPNKTVLKIRGPVTFIQGR